MTSAFSTPVCSVCSLKVNVCTNQALPGDATGMASVVPGVPVYHQDWETQTLIEFGTEITILWKSAGSACRSCFMDIYYMSRYLRNIRCPNLDDKRVRHEHMMTRPVAYGVQAACGSRFTCRQ